MSKHFNACLTKSLLPMMEWAGWVELPLLVLPKKAAEEKAARDAAVAAMGAAEDVEAVAEVVEDVGEANCE